MNVFKVYNKDAEYVYSFTQKSKVTQEQRVQLNCAGYYLRDQISRSGKKVVRTTTPIPTPIKLSGDLA